MEQTKETIGMLDLIESPAFCVKNGIIARVNAAALRLTIAEGTAISTLLKTGQLEYQEYSGGCLYLSLQIGGVTCGATVNRMDGFDIFLIEENDDSLELQTMALAAQELRQPLTNIMTVANQLFPLADDSASPEIQAYISRINRGLFQMQRIITNMSDAYRYQLECLSRKETIDVCAFIGELFTSAAPLIQYTGMELQYTGLTDSIYCLVDKEKLERAVNNILSNALKFAPKNSCITAKLTTKGTMLYLTVQDTGNGIQDELRADVFRRFRRAPGLEDSRFGIGLGMVLIRNAASVHGGTVLLEQSKTLGNRLTMTLLIDQHQEKVVHSPVLTVDYAGGWDHRLLELSESLPASIYQKENIN